MSTINYGTKIFTHSDAGFASFESQLHREGWHRDPARMAWVNPNGGVILDEDLYKMAREGIFQMPVPKPRPVSWNPVPTQSKPVGPKPRPYDDAAMLRMRLGIPHGESFPWGDGFILRGEQFVSVIIATNKNDTINVLQDDAVLYPSDTLIAKLRLLEP